MWLPTPVYERVPQFWLLLGLLFMSSGTYLGFEYSLSFVYFGAGFVSCIWSLWVFSMRLRHRTDQGQNPVLQTSEEAQAEVADTGAEPAA